MVPEAINLTRNESLQDVPNHQAIIFFEIFSILVIMVSMLLNGFILLIIVGSVRLRKQHNIFTFNMALIDMITAFIGIYFTFESSPLWSLVLLMTWSSCTVASGLNFLIVAVYRFITVHVDPFGVRNLVTTPRCIFACALAWLVGSFPLVEVLIRGSGVWISVSVGVVFALTGICYALLYRGVTRSRLVRRGVDPDEQRLKENRHLLRTFAATYITNVAIWLARFPFGFLEDSNLALHYIRLFSYAVSLIANPVIFWVRSKEFKEEVKRYRRHVVLLPVNGMV